MDSAGPLYKFTHKIKYYMSASKLHTFWQVCSFIPHTHNKHPDWSVDRCQNGNKPVNVSKEKAGVIKCKIST